MEYGYQRQVQLSFEEADKKIRETLKARGFGILTEIDVKKTLKEKLNESFKKYKILGACNPPIAHKALTMENEIGLLLPCNVILWENKDGSTTVTAIDAKKMLSIVELDGLDEMASHISGLLKEAVDAL